MKLLRWLLSNIFLIVIVLAACYSYVYWDNLTGKDTPAGEAIAWLSEEFEEFDELAAYLSVTSSGTEEAPVETTGQSVTAVTNTNTLPREIVEKYSAPITRQNREPVPSQNAANDRFITPEVERSLSQASSENPVAEPLTTRELWMQARRSFYRRDFSTSIKSYEQLISKTTDNFDAHGELGNVYFNQGKMQEAASSYFNAAEVLVRLGQVDRASSLLGMLRQMDTEKAEELQLLIDGTQS
jgi:tetratricopeptide (TPR) repeat protein